MDTDGSSHSSFLTNTAWEVEAAHKVGPFLLRGPIRMCQPHSVMQKISLTKYAENSHTTSTPRHLNPANTTIFLREYSLTI